MLVPVSRRLELPVNHGSLRLGTALQEGAAVLHAIDGFIQERHLPIQLVWFGREVPRLGTGEEGMGSSQPQSYPLYPDDSTRHISVAISCIPQAIWFRPPPLLDHKPQDGEERWRNPDREFSVPVP